MSAEWFVHQKEKVHGPFDAATLKQFAASNKIGANTLIAQSADGPWHPASRVKGLFSGSPAPQAFSAPPPPVKVQAATPVADAARISPSVSPGFTKADTDQSLENVETTVSERAPWSFEPPGWLIVMVLVSPLLPIGLVQASRGDQYAKFTLTWFVAISLLVWLHELWGRSKGVELSCPKCDALTRRGGRPAWQILVSIFLFPIGLFALLGSRNPTVCEKCGYRWLA